MTQQAIGYGYGKTILFGEHFVVHSIPAIASALDLKTTAKITESSKSGIYFIDESRPSAGNRTFSFSEQPDDILSKLVDILFQQMNLDKNTNITIELTSTVPEFGGAGLSAALSVSIVKSLNEYYKLQLPIDKVNVIAYEGEKMFHGTPSGIDNTVATYGGLLWFVRGNPNIIEPLYTHSKGLLVIGDTRIHHNTKKLVAEVKRRKESEPEVYNPIFERAKELVLEARKNLIDGNWIEIGKLMVENHTLLQKIGVSIPELDKLVEIALDSGASGAKLTGGGGGGCMIALAPTKEIQDKIIMNMKSAGFHCYATTIG